jgi:antitoxin component YwqK of YwqJK toxin-antitoxin module
MATVNKDFKIKQGLIVEGSTATVAGKQVLTEDTSDQYILDLVGGQTLVTSVEATQMEVIDGELNIKSGVFDAANSASTAQTNAQGYADGLASNYDASGSASTAQTNAQGYADGLAVNYDASGAAETAQTNAQGYADGLAGNYDSYGSAANVAGLLTTHEQLTSNVHGVSGNVVGTSDTQDLSNKRIIDTLAFSDGVTIANEGEIAILAGSHEFEIQANLGDLGLKTTASTANVVITSQSGNIVLNTVSGDSYLGTVSAGNEIATEGYVDTHANATANVHGVSGNVVGTSDTQTLTNKTIGDTLNFAGAGDMTINSDSNVVLTPAVGSYVKWGADVLATQTYADAAAGYALADAEEYTDNAVAALVDSAPELLDTLNELAQAIASNPNYATDIANLISTKQNTLIEGDGIDVTDNTISVTVGSGIEFDGFGQVSVDRTTVDTWYDSNGSASTAQTNAQGYADGLAGNYDASGSAATAQTNAQGYADGLATNYDASGSAATAQTNAQGYADGLATNYDASGSASTAQTNAQGYADGLAVNYDASGSAATAQTNAQGYADGLAVNYDASGAAANALIDAQGYADEAAGNALTSAQGYADGLAGNYAPANAIGLLTTDDIEEGANNLYFTDTRVTDAIQNVLEIAPQAIDITWVRREEATWTEIATPSKVACHSASTSEGSMKYLVRVTASIAGTWHSHVTEVLATVDAANNVAVLEYGTIYTSANPLATVTVEWNAGTSKYDLNVTTVNNSSEVLVAVTLIADRD